MIQWESAPKRVLLTKKWRNEAITEWAATVAHYLQDKGHTVLVEAYDAEHDSLLSSFEVARREGANGAFGQGVDLMVCLGGDGTMLRWAPQP